MWPLRPSTGPNRPAGAPETPEHRTPEWDQAQFQPEDTDENWLLRKKNGKHFTTPTCKTGSSSNITSAAVTSFSYWISNIALELPRSCITDSACFSSSSRFIVLWKHKRQGEWSQKEGSIQILEVNHVKSQMQFKFHLHALKAYGLVSHLMESTKCSIIQYGNTLHLLSVKTRCYSAVLRIWLVDLRVCVQQSLHGSVAIKGSYIE